MKMEYLQACLLEVCRLFPPVTRTFVAARDQDVFEGRRVPAGTEILHCFTEHHRDTSADTMRRAVAGSDAAVVPRLRLSVRDRHERIHVEEKS